MTSHEAKMPEPVAGVMLNPEGRPVLLDRGDNYRGEIVSRRGLQPLYTADLYRRGYLAGLEAARQAVGEAVTYTDLKGPEPGIPEHNAYNRGLADGMNGHRAAALATLTALVKEAKK